MIRSMTGFGTYELKNENHVVRASVRATNGKSLKVTSRLSEQLAPFEADVEKVIREAIERGTLYAVIEHEVIRPQAEYEFNVEAVKAYYSALRAIQNEIGCEGRVELSAILPLPGTLSRRSSSWDGDNELREKLIQAMRGALQAMVAMRENEGRLLAEEITMRTGRILDLLAGVEGRTADMVAQYRDRLRERVAQLLEGSGVSVDESNLCREVAVFAQRSDISEEISRLKSHVSQMRQAIEKGGPVGRKLEFITQEMSREANTMASKAGGCEILPDVVEIRAEVDRIREQVFNIE